MLPLLVALGMAFAAQPQAERGSVEGIVRSSDYPLPGAAITVDGPARVPTVISNSGGVFRIEGLALGTYTLTVALPGFRTETRQLDVGASEPVVLDIVMRLATLQHLDFAVWPADASWEKSDAVAHLRIERSLPPGPCLGTVGTSYQAHVLSVGKGDIPPIIEFGQDNSGACIEPDGTQVRGDETPYRAGDEFLVFLVCTGTRFSSLSGFSTTFRVRDGRVIIGNGFPPLAYGMSVEQALDALRRSRP